MNAPLPQVRDQARGRWRAVLPRLGVSSEFLDGKQRPCPVCGGKDRARFDDLEGDGTWFCNKCGAGDGMKLAMAVTGMGFAQAALAVRRELPDAPVSQGKPRRDDASCIRDSRALWKMSRPLAGTMAEEYLRSRGIPREAIASATDLRFIDRLRAKEHEAGYLPALLARVSDVNGAGVNIHRTFLVDGRKAYRAMMPGPLPEGCAIRLGPVGEHLGVAEGIETALRAGIRFGLTCWSTITAGGMKRWKPPAETRRVTICGDNDASYDGQASAYALAHRLTVRPDPVECDVKITPTRGADWADELADG